MIKRKPEEPVSDKERTGVPPFSMETITSRKNSRVQALRLLGRDKAYRRGQGLFLCDGEKLLSEALANGAEIAEIYLRGAHGGSALPKVPVYALSEDVFDYASPLEHSPGPLFTADPYKPKTVRAAMGALFRQRIWEPEPAALGAKLCEWELPLLGAALRADSVDVKSVSLRRAAIAVGNEGRGLTDALLAMCDQKIILPMTPGSESLNAAVAASVLMWEMWTQRG